MIADLPDNPKINRVTTKCFVMKSSDLGRNWSPEYHDFRIQYKSVIFCIKRSRNVIAALRQITINKKVQTSHGNFITLHPEVIANLKTLLTEE
jgi:hypothetical protein